MTPESLPDLNQVTQRLELRFDLAGVAAKAPGAKLVGVTAEPPPADGELKARIAGQLRRAA